MDDALGPQTNFPRSRVRSDDMWNTQKEWERAPLKLVGVCAAFLTALTAKAISLAN